MKRVLIFVAGAAIAFGLAGIAFTTLAQDETPEPAPPPDDPYQWQWFQRGYPGGPFCRLIALREELGLSDEQIEQLEQLSFDHQRRMVELQARLRIAGMELAGLMRERGNDEAAMAKAMEINGLRTEMMGLSVRHQLDRRAVFTDEQWETIRNLGRQRGFMGRRGDSFRNRPGPGRGFGRRW